MVESAVRVGLSRTPGGSRGSGGGAVAGCASGLDFRRNALTASMNERRGMFGLL